MPTPKTRPEDRGEKTIGLALALNKAQDLVMATPITDHDAFAAAVAARNALYGCRFGCGFNGIGQWAQATHEDACHAGQVPDQPARR
jgi:hypothetical protein